MQSSGSRVAFSLCSHPDTTTAPGGAAFRITMWAMSEENVEVVRRAIAAVNQRDVDGYLGLCAPRGAKLCRIRVYNDPDEGLRAAGLSGAI
jgi:hypothetical protein